MKKSKQNHKNKMDSSSSPSDSFTEEKPLVMGMYFSNLYILLPTISFDTIDCLLSPYRFIFSIVKFDLQFFLFLR